MYWKTGLLYLILWSTLGECQTDVIISGKVAPGGVRVPSSPCPSLFDYVWWRNEVVGKVAVPPPQRASSSEPISFIISLAMEQFSPAGYSGLIELFGVSRRMVLMRLQSGDNTPIPYRVRFPLRNPIPSVSSIEINGRQICQGYVPNNDPRITIFSLSHIMTPGGSASYYVPMQAHQFTNPTQQSPPQQSTWAPSLQHSTWQPPPEQSTYRQNLVTQTPLPPHLQQLPQSVGALAETKPIQGTKITIQVTRPENSMQGPYSNCGQTAIKVTRLVVNGSPTVKGQWPWLTALFFKTDVGQEFQCGGSLVSQQHVITAAHCIKDPSKPGRRPEDFIIYVGKYNLRRAEPESQPRDVSRIIIHPGYTSYLSSEMDDIAIMVLESSVQITNAVRPVCLWPADQPQLDHVIKRRGIVVGWGRNENGSRVTPEPKMTTIPVVSQEECLRSHENFHRITSNKTFCAGGRDGSGPCTGDSGGGMYFYETLSDGSSRWMLRGVVSLSLAADKTCDLSNFVIFSDVAKYMQWITETMDKYAY